MKNERWLPTTSMAKLLQRLFLLAVHVINDIGYVQGKDPATIGNIRSSEKATRLTFENFDELTSGKIVFIKFFSPFCPHCNSLAPAWNQLASFYEELNDDNALIGSVDCTDSPHGKKLCAKFKIVGLPTLYYGDASFGGVYLKEYGGDKSYQDLKKFALDKLVPTCSPGRLDACASDVRDEMEAYMTMSYYELDEKIKAIEKRKEDDETSFASKFDDLQKQYDGILTEKEMAIIRANTNKKLIQEVIALKQE